MTCGKERAWSDHVLGCSVPANRAGAEQQEPEVLKELMLSPFSSVMASLKYKHRQKTSPFSRTWAWVMLKMFCKSTPSVSSADSSAVFTLCAEGLPKALWSRLAVTVQTQQTLLSLRPVPEPRARIQRKSLGPRSSHARDERGFDTACNRTTSRPLLGDLAQML